MQIQCIENNVSQCKIKDLQAFRPYHIQNRPNAVTAWAPQKNIVSENSLFWIHKCKLKLNSTLQNTQLYKQNPERLPPLNVNAKMWNSSWKSWTAWSPDLSSIKNIWRIVYGTLWSEKYDKGPEPLSSWNLISNTKKKSAFKIKKLVSSVSRCLECWYVFEMYCWHQMWYVSFCYFQSKISFKWFAE